MKTTTILLLLAVSASAVGCGGDTDAPEQSGIQSDFSTPEGAILRLEDAYRAKDLEAAVACKDFRTEARLMLERLGTLPKDQIDDALIDETAKVLELGYRAEIQQQGFPDMTGVKSSFPAKETRQEGVVAVTEVCTYPDGGTSQQKILVGHTSNGWRVLNVTE